jgi:hypothetical protein
MASEFLPAFTHFAVDTETRFLIQSVCTKCGASKLVSASDGSLQTWEAEHTCKSENLTDGRLVKMPDRVSA